jgi:hypothetical protein
MELSGTFILQPHVTLPLGRLMGERVMLVGYKAERIGHKDNGELATEIHFQEI